MSEIMNEVARPSLKQLATVLVLGVERIKNVAKKPIVGQAYDPKAINWDAVDAFITNRLERTGYDSLEAVYAAALEVEETVRVAGGASKAMLDIEGSTTTPARKSELAAGDVITEKATGENFEVCYVNETIVVYKPISAEGKVTLSHAIGNRIFNNKFAKVVAEATTTDEVNAEVTE
jgi:hypothetical protein